MNDRPYALKVEQLNCSYDKTPVLWDISLEVPQGELVAIIGPNGAGKSTFIKAALGLVKPLSGTIFCLGAPLQKVRKFVAYVPQRESVDWEFPLTVFDLVLMGRYGKMGLFKRPSKQDRDAVFTYLDKVGLKTFADRQISELSGGQQQRAFLARALIQEAELYFMDEPFSGIDIPSTQVIVDILKDLKKQGKTVFIVHHDLATVSSTFTYVIMLNLRLVAFGEVSKIFTSDLIQRTYGQAGMLLSEVAKLHQQKGEKLHS